MKKTNLLVTSCLLTISATAMAGQALPPAPSLNVFQSTAKCSNYVNKVGNYLQAKGNFFGYITFHSFESVSGNAYMQICNNGTCTNYYDFSGSTVGSSGQDSLCYLAVNGSASVQANMLSTYLAPDYQAAVVEGKSTLGYPVPAEGFYGPAATCTGTTLNQCSIAATMPPAPSR